MVYQKHLGTHNTTIYSNQPMMTSACAPWSRTRNKSWRSETVKVRHFGSLGFVILSQNELRISNTNSHVVQFIKICRIFFLVQISKKQKQKKPKKNTKTPISFRPPTTKRFRSSGGSGRIKALGSAWDTKREG